MIESAIRAERLELPSSPVPVYLWEVPQKPVCVRIPFALIDRLEHEAVESFRSLSSRGSEIGGVLLGGVSPGNPAIVTLQDFELITCDYARGPLYRLSDADLDRFDRAFAQHTAAGRPVVGFFRSHTRKGVQLDPEDITLIDSRFSAPHQIALLIRPFATKPSLAGIFIREDGTVRGESSHKEFPFRSSHLTAMVRGESAAQTERPTATPMPPAAAPSPKPAARAQIVPIASRRDPAPPMPPSEPVAAAPPTPVETPAPVEALAPAPVAPAPAPKVETPKVEAPKVEAPKVEPPKVAAPKVEAPKVEPPKVAAPKVETPEVEAPKVEAPKIVAELSRPVVEPEPAPEMPATVEPETHGSGKLLWIVSAVAAALLAGVLLFVYPGFLMHRGAQSAVTAQQDNSALDLRVQRNGGELVLIWNRDSDVVRNAAHAVLSISDGERQENAQLDIETLRSGTITYTPATGDVVFKLEVTGANQAKTSSALVRALQMRPSPMPQPGTEQASASSAPPEAPATAPAEETAVVEEAAPAKTPDRPLRPFRAESLAQRLRPSTPADLPLAPSVAAARAPGAAPIPALNLGAPLPPPPQPRPASASPFPASPKPVVTGGNIVQAVLISRKDPDYPKIARDAGAKGLVELIATIGVNGRVKSVKVLRGHPMLQKAATDAVMQWVYKPTLLNGVPVEGQVQVSVNFLGR